jgi:hypothetical protein
MIESKEWQSWLIGKKLIALQKPIKKNLIILSAIHLGNTFI